MKILLIFVCTFPSFAFCSYLSDQDVQILKLMEKCSDKKDADTVTWCMAQLYSNSGSNSLRYDKKTGSVCDSVSYKDVNVTWFEAGLRAASYIDKLKKKEVSHE